MPDRRPPTRFIFVTGGVVSALGKGITAASIGRLLVSRGHEVAQFKIDASDAILASASHGVTHRTMVGIIARRVHLPD